MNKTNKKKLCKINKTFQNSLPYIKRICCTNWTRLLRHSVLRSNMMRILSNLLRSEDLQTTVIWIWGILFVSGSDYSEPDPQHCVLEHGKSEYFPVAETFKSFTPSLSQYVSKWTVTML